MKIINLGKGIWPVRGSEFQLGAKAYVYNISDIMNSNY